MTLLESLDSFTSKDNIILKYVITFPTFLGGEVAETINFWVIPFYRDKIKFIIQLARYKIQQDKNFPVSPAKVWKVAKHVLVNQVRK